MKPPSQPKKPHKSGRDQRLAAALRENLRRRKAQERERNREESQPAAEQKPR